MTTDAPPAWALGYPVDELRAAADVYRASDRPYALGAFSMVKEATIATWLRDGEANMTDSGAYCRMVIPQRELHVRDFTGERRATIPAGSFVMRNPAATTDSGWAELYQLLTGDYPVNEGRPRWLEGWLESPYITALAQDAGLELRAVKIKASSELVGVWAPQGSPVVPMSGADWPTLALLSDQAAPIVPLVAAAAADLGAIDGWADHYSTYNARHAWSALSIRGYHVLDAGPAELQIAKPAEMSKQWKAENPGWDAWPLDWTPLWDRHPTLQALVQAVMAALAADDVQRVRLMRLAPGGGELTRHSDITDPDAGTADGKVARIHVPLVTNPGVVFEQWGIDGRRYQAHMAAGTIWYLDTRKPHRAANRGEAPRVHLVLDVFATPELRELIAGAPVPELAE